MAAPTGSLTVSPASLPSGAGATPLFTRAHHLVGSSGSSALSNGTLTWAVMQQRHLAIVGGTGLRLVYANVTGFETPQGTITDQPNSNITISATLWSGATGVSSATQPGNAGTPVDVTFDGASSVILGPGQVVVSDPIPGVTIVAGQTYFTRTLTQVAAGDKWPLGRPISAINFEGCQAGTGTPGDVLHTGTVSGATQLAPHPVATLGTVATATPVVGFFGTSITNGTGATFDEAHIVQACKAAGLPYVACGKGGDSAFNFKLLAHHRARYAYLGASTDVICEHIVNDFSSSTFATVAGDLRELHRQVKVDLGKRIWQLTAPPSYNKGNPDAATNAQEYLATGDYYTTLANQAPSGSDAVRVAVNEWIRAGCPESAQGVPVAPGTAGAVASPYLSGYFETADAVESARNSGKWKVGDRGRTVIDAAITAGTNQLSSATAAFAAADVGRQIVVRGAGTAGAAILPGSTTITAVAGDGLSATISRNASTTITAGTAHIDAVPWSDAVGVHPNQTGHAAMAAAIDLQRIRTAFAGAGGGGAASNAGPVKRLLKLGGGLKRLPTTAS